MKIRILAIFAIIAVFGLVIASYAYNQGTVAPLADKESCCKKDSCPMMNKGEHGKDHAKGEGHKCCGDSCPMKGENGKGGDHAKAEGHSCCGDSCPMKKEGAASAAGAHEAGCCDSCACCKGEHAKKPESGV